MAEEMKNAPEFKVRYSDEELQEFKAIILEMLEKAKSEYKQLRDIITHDSSNDIEDTSPTFKIMEEGATALSKEEAGALAQRQYKFIQNLRKSSGFDVTDKVTVCIYADGEDLAEIQASLAVFADYVGSQTLALSVTSAALAEAGDAPEVEWNEGAIRIAVAKC